MLLAILSDSHDNRENILEAVRLLREVEPDAILHLGDVCAPYSLELFSGLPVHFCFGNCDWDKEALKEATASAGCAGIDSTQELDLLGKRILACHGDNGRFLNHAIASGEFDYVFHGHTHVKRDERIGNTRVINPGALHRAAEYSFAVLNLETDELQYISVNAS